jgi:hypothetical protein
MIEKLKAAIAGKIPIEFSYNKPGKIPGTRKGHPHAVFIMNKKDNSQSTKVHIVQTGGVTDSVSNFPEFRTFDIEELSDIVLKRDDAPFESDESYNPLWEGYAFVIAKV